MPLWRLDQTAQGQFSFYLLKIPTVVHYGVSFNQVT